MHADTVTAGMRHTSHRLHRRMSPGRGTWARALDGLVGRASGLPPERTDFEVQRRIQIPTRDGVFLAADHYQPESAAVGTILIRGPYGRSLPLALPLARLFAARGYHALFVSSRGTFGSGGTFEPMATEVDDGHDAVAWMLDQPWFTGSFATIGPSYLGHTQWAILSDPPAEMAAAVISVGPHDFAEHVWGTGAFKLDFLGWSDGIVHQEDLGPVGALVRAVRAGRRVRAAQEGLPLAAAADGLLEGRAPWYRDWVTRADTGDDFWLPMRHGAALERADIPVLLIGGWRDLFLEQTVEQYDRLHDRGTDVALTVGPWNHYQAGAARIVTRETFAWLEQHLADHPGPPERHRVHAFLTGAGEWRHLEEWPPPTSPATWYLQPARPGSAGPGRLRPGAPTDDPPSRFTYDPARPTPTVGGPLLSRRCRVDDTVLAGRADVLVFDAGPLSRDLDVAGSPEAELDHTSDNPHFDLFVRLSEVDPDGRSHNLTEGYRRFGPDRPAASPVGIAMAPLYHRLRAGWRLRLLVAGGSFPRFDRNLGTGEPPGTGVSMRPAQHTVAHGSARMSKLVLPVVD